MYQICIPVPKTQDTQAVNLFAPRCSNGTHILSAICLQELEIVQLISVLHNVLLDLASNRPCHKILCRSCNKVRRIGNRLYTDTYVTLLNHFRSSLNRLGHAQSRHDNRKASTRKGADRSTMLNGRQLGRR